MKPALLLGFFTIACFVTVPVALPSSKASPLHVVEANNAFAWDLLGQAPDQESNFFFSPYSISNALAMTMNGARGQTAAQMARVMHLPNNSAEVDPAFSALIRQLNGNGLPRDYQLSVANSLWAQQGVQVEQSFLNSTRDSYGAKLRQLNFARDPDAARKTINQWIAGRTQDKIKELLAKGDITTSTSFALVNAIYFKSAWDSQFVPTLTEKDATFTIRSGAKVVAPLMHQTGSFKYVETAQFQAIDLPYEGRDLSMVVILPKAVGELDTVEKSLSAEKLAETIKQMKPQSVAVGLPRFTMRTRLSLVTALQSLGMTDAFDGSKANFTGMCKNERWAISQVVHEAFVDVNEEGTEAAAATAVIMIRASQAERRTVFRADHPFMFLIRDNHTGCILFLGRVANPVAA